MGALLGLWRFCPVYIIVIATICGLTYVGVTYVDFDMSNRNGQEFASTGPILFSGVVVAVIAIFANSWSQWQTSHISHGLQGLQTLRTDREYLINSNMVQRTIAASSGSEWGKPLGPSMKQAFRNVTMGPDVDHPSFREASLFLLNQYEFLAAATRSGGIDLVLMDKTMAGPIRNLVTTYSEEIVELRKTASRTFTNVIWLHRTISGSLEPYLGPDDIGD